jgi:hypothetical protein
MNKSIIKKIGVVALTLTLIFGLAACDNSSTTEPVTKPKISSFGEVTRNVEFGATKDVALNTLPAKVTATLSDSSEKEVNVEWAAPEAYDGNTAGNYTFKGVVNDSANKDDLNATAVVTVQPQDTFTVDTVSAIDDINVAYDTAADDIGLPETVEVTLSDETTADAAVEWDTSNYDGTVEGEVVLEGTLDVSGLENVAETDKTASVTVIVGKNPADYEDLDQESFEGTLATDLGVASLDSVDEDVTLPSEMTVAGNEYTVVWTDADGNEVTELTRLVEEDLTVELTGTLDYVGPAAAADVKDEFTVTITVKAREIAAITGEAAEAEKTVGEDVEVTFTMLDKDEVAIEGEMVRVRVLDGTEVINTFDDIATDANGEVTVSYGSEVVDPADLTFRALSVKKPVIRADVSVSWIAARSDMIVLAEEDLTDDTLPTTEKTAGAKYTLTDSHERTYEVTFYDEFGEPLADGEDVYVQIDGGLIDSATVLTASDFTQVGSTEEYAEYTLANGDGTATLVINHDVDGDTLTPTFFVGPNDNDISTATVKVEAGATTFEDRVFSEANSSLTAVDNDIVDVSAAREYEVVALDQFGDPFDVKTTLIADFVEAQDDTAANDPAGSYTYVPALANTDKVDLTSVNADGEMSLTIASDTNETLTPLLWVNSDLDEDSTPDGYTADQPQLTAAATTWENSTLTQLDVTMLESGSTINPLSSVATADNTVFEIELQNQWGEVMPTSAGAGQYYNVILNVYDGNGDLVEFTATSAVQSYDATGETYGDTAETDEYDLTDITTDEVAAPNDTFASITPAAGQQKIAVAINGDELDISADGPYTVRAFVDINSNSEKETDEFATTADFDLEVEYATAGEFTAIAANTAATIGEFEEGSFDAVVVEDGNGVALTYTIKDQIEADFANSTDDIILTVDNNTDQDITVAGETIAAGDTGIEVVIAERTGATEVIDVVSTDGNIEGDVTVTAMVDGVTASEDSYSILYGADVADGTTDGYYADTTVAAFNDTNEIVLVENADGDYMLFSFDDNVYTDGITYRVNNTTVTKGTFWYELALEETVNFDIAGTGKELDANIIK